MKTTTYRKDETRFLSNGQPLRLYITRSTPLPVMCGPTDVCSMRYGVLDTNRLKEYQTSTLVFVSQLFAIV